MIAKEASHNDSRQDEYSVEDDKTRKLDEETLQQAIRNIQRVALIVSQEVSFKRSKRSFLRILNGYDNIDTSSLFIHLRKVEELEGTK